MPDASAGRITVRIEAAAAQFHTAMGRVRKDASRSVDSLNRTMKRAGVGVAALGVASVKMAATFDKELTEVASLMDGVTNKQIKQMGEQLKTLSVTANQSLSSLTKAKYDIVSAGFTDSADSALLLENAAKLASATVSDAGTTGAVLTKVLNAYSLAAIDAAKVSNILAVGIKKGQTTMAELGPTIGQVIPTAAELGIGLDEVVAGIATLTAAAGQQTPEAMTALNAAMVSFLKPSDAMTKALIKSGHESGRSLLEAEGLAGGLVALEKAAAELNMDISEVFPNIRAMRAAFPLAGKQAGIFAENLRATREDTEALGSMFKTVAESDSFKLEQGIKQLNVTMIELGSVILPEVAKLAGTVSQKLKDSRGAVESAGKAMAFAVEHAEGLAKAFVGLKLLTIAKDIAIVATAFAGLNLAINPVGVAIAALVVGFTALFALSKKELNVKADITDLNALNKELEETTEKLKTARFGADTLGAGWVDAGSKSDAFTKKLEDKKKALEDLIKVQETAAAALLPAAITLPAGGIGPVFGPQPSAAPTTPTPAKKVTPVSAKALTELEKLQTASSLANVQLQEMRDSLVAGEASSGQYAVAIENAAKADTAFATAQDLTNQAIASSQIETLQGLYDGYAVTVTEAGFIVQNNIPLLFPVKEVETFASTLLSDGLAAWQEYSEEIALAAEYASAAIEIGSTIQQIAIDTEIAKIKEASDTKITTARDTADAEKKILETNLKAKKDAIDKDLKAGLITQDEARKRRIAADEAAATTRANIASTLADTITDVEKAGNDAISDERRKQKPFLIAEAVVNTAVGATAALKTDPTGILSALVTVLGGVQIAKIASQKFQSGVSIVPGFGSGDIVNATLEPQEAVLNKTATREMGLSEIDSRNRGTFGDQQAINLNVSISTLDAESYEDKLNSSWRDATIRFFRDVLDRGAGAANT